MGIDYESVLGVGVEQEDITFKNLTDEGRDLVMCVFYESSNEEQKLELDQMSSEEKDEYMDDWFSENLWDYDLFYDLGLEAYSGNMMVGRYGYRGVYLSLRKPENAHAEIVKAVEQFKKVVNLEPEIFCDILVS